MAHLIYKAPLVDEKSRQKYIQTRKEIDGAKGRGELDPAGYKKAKRNLEEAMSTVITPPEGDTEGQTVLELVRSTSMSSSSTGSRTNRSSSASGSNALSKTQTAKNVKKGELTYPWMPRLSLKAMR